MRVKDAQKAAEYVVGIAVAAPHVKKATAPNGVADVIRLMDLPIVGGSRERTLRFSNVGSRAQLQATAHDTERRGTWRWRLGTGLFKVMQGTVRAELETGHGMRDSAPIIVVTVVGTSKPRLRGTVFTF